MKLNFSRIFLFFFITTIFWFLSSGPNDYPNEFLLFALGIFFIGSIFWNDLLFRIFRGDLVTYAAVGQVISYLFGIPAIVFILFLLRSDAFPSGLTKDISIVFLAVSFVSIISIPVFSSNSVGPLPNLSSRRNYSEDGIQETK